ncbi:unnamed protein product [Ranitomeya imitator]|uniref:G-protein coupled receptors family 3 profile domain-containing protein n=1 Tax=Ranitomeya imitator TaxID=111125 RepID=A0ABN9MJH7_9NEOB|nr:unnamed protein product [Ranitomeya imitator]
MQGPHHNRDTTDVDLQESAPQPSTSSELTPGTLAHMAEYALRILKRDPRIIKMMSDDDYWLACLLDPQYKGKLQNIMPHENLEQILATKQATLVDCLVRAFPAHIGGDGSHTSHSVSCQKCPEDQWPNDFNQCVPKPIEYLSYKNDPAVLVISVISVLCFVKTTVILGIFILFQETPVVQANNHTLSFILLVSIMLSFLCVFLFLDRPTHVTCMLRQTSFGIREM